MRNVLTNKMLPGHHQAFKAFQLFRGKRARETKTLGRKTWKKNFHQSSRKKKFLAKNQEKL